MSKGEAYKGSQYRNTIGRSLRCNSFTTTVKLGILVAAACVDLGTSLPAAAATWQSLLYLLVKMPHCYLLDTFSFACLQPIATPTGMHAH